MSNGRILVIEDDKILRLTVLSQLKRLDHAGIALSDGTKALEEVQSGQYDMILMDVQMPKFSGLEATAEIRAWERVQKKARIPIVAMTANPNRKQCFEAGMSDFLFKPHSLSDLKKMIDKWTPDEPSS